MLTISNEQLAHKLAKETAGDCLCCVARNLCSGNGNCWAETLLWLKGKKEIRNDKRGQNPRNDG